MLEPSFKKLIILFSVLIGLIVIFKLFKIEAKVSLDALKVKMRVQIILFGFLKILNIKIFYKDCGLFLEKANGKIKPIIIKPMSKFETKMGINIFKIMVEKKLYLNMLLGIDSDAYTTSLISGGIVATTYATQCLFDLKLLDVIVNSTAESSKAQIFLKFKFKTSIAKIFKTVLVSL